MQEDEPFFAIRVRGKVEDVATILAALDEAAARYDVFLQACDADWVYNEEHARSAHAHAVRAHRRDEAASRTLGGEFLCYLAARRQIGKAIQEGGIKEGQEAFVLVAAGAKAGAAVWRLLDKLGMSRDPNGIPDNETALDRLGVTKAEREAVAPDRRGELALERVALVDLER